MNLLFLRDSLSTFLGNIWEMNCSFPPTEAKFFRVTEEDAGGLFHVAQGGSYMERQEFDGRFDFKLKFAPSVWTREAQKERSLQVYGLSLQNPLIAGNPRALWVITTKLLKEFDMPELAAALPEPPAPDISRSPKEEWNAVLQGDDIDVHPQDNDQEHLVDHARRIQRAALDPDYRDGDAVNRMLLHIEEHQAQAKAKLIAQSMMEGIANSMQQLTTPPAAPPVEQVEEPMEPEPEPGPGLEMMPQEVEDDYTGKDRGPAGVAGV